MIIGTEKLTRNGQKRKMLEVIDTIIGFKFKSSFPTEFLEFTCEFLDNKADQIKFADGENKVPIIDLQIDILK